MVPELPSVSRPLGPPRGALCTPEDGGLGLRHPRTLTREASLSSLAPGLPWRERRPLAATTRVLTGLSPHFRKVVVNVLGPSRSG